MSQVYSIAQLRDLVGPYQDYICQLVMTIAYRLSLYICLMSLWEYGEEHGSNASVWMLFLFGDIKAQLTALMHWNDICVILLALKQSKTRLII